MMEKCAWYMRRTQMPHATGTSTLLRRRRGARGH
ncbi:unnamed protein product [Ectocarpus sp. 12 AP-2014]